VSAAAEPETRADALEELATALRGLLAASRRLRGREAQRAVPAHTHFSVLRLLAERSELTAGQIAEAADFSAAFVTDLLDHLEERGLVRRRRSTADRRVVLVQLTGRGRRVYSTRHAELTSAWEEALAGLSDDELRDGARVLDTVRDYLETLAGTPGRRGLQTVRSDAG